MNKFSALCTALAFSAFTAVLAPAVAQAQTAGRPEMGTLPEAYRDDKQLSVTVVRYGPKANKQALVELAGLDHPWNRRIFLANVVDVARRAGEVKNSYWIQLAGKPWGLVAQDLGYGGPMLNLCEDGDTGKNVRYPIYYSKELSEQSNAQFMLTAYLEQEKDPKRATARYKGNATAARLRAGGK